MPKIGIPASTRAGSIEGAPSVYTLDGPPDRMIAAGLFASISSTVAVCGTTSEYTWASRTRRALSWAYSAPKSTTRTGPVGLGTAEVLGPAEAALDTAEVLGPAEAALDTTCSSWGDAN